jgi:hypothetical protein
MTIRPIIKGLISYFRPKPKAMGAMTATAPGLTAAMAVAQTTWSSSPRE